MSTMLDPGGRARPETGGPAATQTLADVPQARRCPVRAPRTTQRDGQQGLQRDLRPDQPRHDQPRHDQPRHDQPRHDQPRQDRPRGDRARHDQSRQDQSREQHRDLPRDGRRDGNRDQRRAPSPIVQVSLDGNRPAWLVLGYRELHFVLSSPEIFTCDPRHRARRGPVSPDWAPLPGAGRRPSLLHTDGDEHRRRYRAINDVLSDVDVFLLRARAEAVTDSVIDEFAGTGSADLISAFAHQVPALALASLCGPDDLGADEIADDLVALVDNRSDAVRGHRRLLDRLRGLLADRLDEPSDDIISTLVDHPEELTDDEIVEDLAVVLGLGMRTVTAWIGTSLRLLLTDGSFALELSGGRRSVMQALTQVLWEDTPVQVAAGRWAARDIQLGGQHIQAGDMIALGLAAANSDPRVTGAGTNSAHLSFGHGAHRCPYPAQEIAEVITRTAIEVLLDRLPNIRLAVPAEALVWRRTAWNRALTALPVRFSPV
ncbi:cytochrome P450 [Parafrankia sp. FMc2]|uniref:cytochrome P450 n=1 Tax=Parafrankia sp. FMc2 TaxID=3233196 RepID=UPI0034D44CC5